MAKIIQTADLLPDSALTRNESDWVYNGLDCCVTAEVFEEILPQLDNITGSTYSFSQALQAPVLDMTLRGVLVNQTRRRKVLREYREQTSFLEARLNELISEGIGVPKLNWRSPAQLKSLLYDVMGLPIVRKRNANGVMAPTVNRDAIEKLSINFIAMPLCNHLLKLRDMQKKISFLETGIDPDGRMRCSFNIAGTDTGRLSSSMSDFSTGTNLQNVDRELRSVFMADAGMKFANLDLEQGDSRNVGAICWNLFVNSHGEAYAGSYLDACESGDLHTRVSKMVWPELGWTGDPSEDKRIAEQLFYRQDSYRQMSKKGGHGTNYYGRDRTMAQHLKMPVSVIRDFQISYFGSFAVIGSYSRDRNLDNWHNWVRNEIRERSMITTQLGRRRFFFGRDNDDATIRKAIAYEPQSMTADEIDQGILKLWRANRVQLLIQVHDSILLQYREEEEDEIIPWALEALRVPMVLAKGRDFCVPTEAKIGWNWGEFDEKENPDGLVKWKGSDKRKRTETTHRLSLSGL